MKKILPVIVGLVILLWACKKDKPDVKLGKLEISDAFALVMCQNDSITDNTDDTLKLYKISADDRLYYVRQYAEDGSFLGFTYQPVAIYDINKASFLFIVSRNGSGTTESYVINKADGTAEQILDFALPKANNGGWNINQSNKIFIKANSDNYYYVGENTINSLSFGEANYPTTAQKADYNPNFDIDTIGNIISGNKLIYKDGTSDVIAEIDENTIVSRNFEQGFYMVKRTASAIQISKIIVGENNYAIEAKGEIDENTDNWIYLGNATFNDSKSSVLVYNLGLVYINNTTQKLFPFSTFSLTEITSFSQSDIYLFVNGLNTLQNEVMLKINPQSGTPIYSHIMVPERYHYYLYQVDNNGNFSFFARDYVKSTDVIGYLSAAQYVNIMDNSQQLVPRQIISIK